MFTSPRLLAGLVILGTLSAQSSPEAEKPPILQLPLDCNLGTDCFVQQYFDHASGKAAKDYRCGSRVYDDHNGTDFRLQSIASQRRGVRVLAAAAGVVKAAGSQYPDRLAVTAADRRAVRGKECGNGVEIDHGGGWATRYCHMAQNSVLVAKGDRVRQGQNIGLVGLSGHTQFPHVHLSVFYRSRSIDPFAPRAGKDSCGAATSSLWAPGAERALAYKATEIINIGFADRAITNSEIEAATIARPGGHSSALAFYGRAIGLQAGDVLAVKLIDPAGKVLADHEVPLTGAEAQRMALVGRQRPAEGWARGVYRGSFTVLRRGEAVATSAASITFEGS